MRNYSDKENSVRVDFFKPSGKWYATEAVEMRCYHANVTAGVPKSDLASLPEALLRALREKLRKPDGTLRYAGMWAVCLDPYHEHSHPQMIVVPER